MSAFETGRKTLTLRLNLSQTSALLRGPQPSVQNGSYQAIRLYRSTSAR